MTSTATFAIPCCNGARFLQPLLRSLLAQTRQDFDLVLVDDASDDRSVEVARAAASGRVRVVVNPERLGIAGNWNRCIEEVRTPFFCLAHQDDVYEPDYYARMLAAVEAGPRIGAAHCLAGTIAADGARSFGPREAYKRKFFDADAGRDRGREYARLYEGNYITCPSLFYRKQCTDDAGPFDQRFEFAMDWAYSFQILLVGWEIVGVPEVLLYYRRHAANKSLAEARTLNRFEEELEVLAWAREEGGQAELLSLDRGPSPAVHNNLLVAALEAMEAGEPETARQLIAFGRERVPGFRSSTTARLVSVCTRLGALGRSLMRLGLRLQLR